MPILVGGNGVAEYVVLAAVRTPAEAKQRAQGFADAGFTELMFDPALATPDQVDRLADAVL